MSTQKPPEPAPARSTVQSPNEQVAPATPENQGSGSINEPPGSQVVPPVEPATPPAEQPEPDEPLPAELERMTRHDLDELAQARGVDITNAGNKDEVIAALRKDERKRRRS